MNNFRKSILRICRSASFRGVTLACVVLVLSLPAVFAQIPDKSDNNNPESTRREAFWKDFLSKRKAATDFNAASDNYFRFNDSNTSSYDDQQFSSGDELFEMMPDDMDSSSQKQELTGPGRWFFGTRIGKHLAHYQTGDIRKRPMMYWRRFADRRVPPVGTFLFFTFFNSLICLVFKKRVSIASSCVRTSFWKSLIFGVAFVILMGSAARLCFDSVIFAPAALLILGVVELLVLGGLAVSSLTVGNALLSKLGVSLYDENEIGDLSTLSFFERLKAHLHYLAPVILATVLVTFITLIPTIGFLPRMGTRFVMWFSVLGLGALVRTKLGRKQLG